MTFMSLLLATPHAASTQTVDILSYTLLEVACPVPEEGPQKQKRCGVAPTIRPVVWVVLCVRPRACA